MSIRENIKYWIQCVKTKDTYRKIRTTFPIYRILVPIFNPGAHCGFAEPLVSFEKILFKLPQMYMNTVFHIFLLVSLIMCVLLFLGNRGAVPKVRCLIYLLHIVYYRKRIVCTTFFQKILVGGFSHALLITPLAGHWIHL